MIQVFAIRKSFADFLKLGFIQASGVAMLPGIDAESLDYPLQIAVFFFKAAWRPNSKSAKRSLIWVRSFPDSDSRWNAIQG